LYIRARAYPAIRLNQICSCLRRFFKLLATSFPCIIWPHTRLMCWASHQPWPACSWP
jgi:hypothetical protein